MGMIDELLEKVAAAIGVDVADLRDFVACGQNHTYAAGDVLFHESTPRKWFGLVEAGEVEIVCGLHGATTHLFTVGAGGMLSEAILLDDSAHSATAIARGGA